MNDAAETLTVAAKPAQADPTQILAAQQAAASDASAGSGIQTGTGITGTPPPADPSSAEVIGEDELVDFGFSKSTQWPCLYDLWQQESGWNVYAENRVRRLRHPAVAARRQDGERRRRLGDRPDDPDHLGPRLHQIDLRHAVRRVGSTKRRTGTTNSVLPLIAQFILFGRMRLIRRRPRVYCEMANSRSVRSRRLRR